MKIFLARLSVRSSTCESFLAHPRSDWKIIFNFLFSAAFQGSFCFLFATLKRLPSRESTDTHILMEIYSACTFFVSILSHPHFHLGENHPSRGKFFQLKLKHKHTRSAFSLFSHPSPKQSPWWGQILLFRMFVLLLMICGHAEAGAKVWEVEMDIFKTFFPRDY